MLTLYFALTTPLLCTYTYAAVPTCPLRFARPRLPAVLLAEPAITVEKLRELLTAGLAADQVRALLAAEGMAAPDIDGLFSELDQATETEEVKEPAAIGAAPPGPPTALAADVFANMQTPIPLDSPEGQAALVRMKQAEQEDAAAAPLAGAPPGPPTVLAADVFANMQTPIPLDSPEGQAVLARIKEAGQEAPAPDSVASLVDQARPGEEAASRMSSPAPSTPAEPKPLVLPLGIEVSPVAFAISAGAITAVSALFIYLLTSMTSMTPATGDPGPVQGSCARLTPLGACIEQQRR